jgi:hypothetical protein
VREKGHLDDEERVGDVDGLDVADGPHHVETGAAPSTGAPWSRTLHVERP